MLNKSIFTYFNKTLDGKVIEWEATIFGITIPWGNWSGDNLPNENCFMNGFILTLGAIIISKNFRPTDSMTEGLDKTKNIPLLMKVVGEKVVNFVFIDSSDSIRCNGYDYVIQKYKKIEGYKLFMPLFPYKVSVAYKVISGVNNVSDLIFYAKRWNTLGREPTDYEIINESIRLKFFERQLRSDLAINLSKLNP